MNSQNKKLVFIVVLLLCFSCLTCKKVFETDLFQLNCNNFQEGLINSDSEMVCEEISKLLYDLHPEESSDDKFGHRENFNILIERINTNCDNVSAELICYACIETNPPQSELKLSTDSSGVEISRILDVRTPEDEILSCIRLH